MKKTLTIILISTIVILTLLLMLPQNQKNTPTFPNIQPPPSTFPKDKTTNIVFTTDKKYKEYLKVALKSTITNKNPNTYYNIYILCIDLPQKETNKFKTFEQDKVKINTVALKSAMVNEISKYGAKYGYRVSKADLFKFFLPEMFKEFDKILYLDCDILVLNDFEQLYNLNLQDKLIGALLEKTNFSNEENSKFNCGVILFNIKKCLENNLTQKLIDAKKADTTRRYVTQLAYTKAIDMKNIYPLLSKYNYLLKDEEVIQKQNNQVIIHFAGFKKPWYNSDMHFADIWWEYARLVNPKWEVEKRSSYLCVRYALASINQTDKSNNLKSAEKLLKKYQRCRCLKKVRG